MGNDQRQIGYRQVTARLRSRTRLNSLTNWLRNAGLSLNPPGRQLLRRTLKLSSDQLRRLISSDALIARQAIMIESARLISSAIANVASKLVRVSPGDNRAINQCSRPG
jgi:hypothetical protein